MLDGNIISQMTFLLDLESKDITIRDLVRVCYVTSDGSKVVFSPEGMSTVLIQLPMQDFREHAMQRITLKVSCSIHPRAEGDDT